MADAKMTPKQALDASLQIDIEAVDAALRGRAPSGLGRRDRLAAGYAADPPVPPSARPMGLVVF